MTDDLNEYCQFAADLGYHPELRAGLAPDVVVELRRLCLEVAHEFPHVVFFAGKLIFSDEIEGFIGRFLHNHTSLELQNWLQLYGYSLVILPIRVGAGSMSQSPPHAATRPAAELVCGSRAACVHLCPSSLPNRSDPIERQMVATKFLDRIEPLRIGKFGCLACRHPSN